MKKVLIGSTLAVGLLLAGAGQASASSVQGIGGVGGVDLGSMDIETALQMVQQQRTNQLESQFQSQIADVQKKNEQIAILNEQLSKLNADISATNDDAIKDELRAQTQELQSQSDTLSNSQQMDMLRLQSLSNKRNEAFDSMTNFLKKMQDSRSSILDNMR
ncbi:hypothetical protein ACIQ2D_10045 [Lysinibacillus sp. NPDC097287]|uniref:hypothetical protein n=1 Tax=Lysinibacillus sp. NPDC097287 TaxID=3364144 RepID=UPI0037F242FC